MMLVFQDAQKHMLHFESATETLFLKEKNSFTVHLQNVTFILKPFNWNLLKMTYSSDLCLARLS